MSRADPARRASLRSPWGADTARRVVAAGAEMSVGTALDCDFVVKDPEVSGTHFVLRWDGRSAIVTDCASRRGTLVGGEPIAEPRELRHGAWIRAGSTDFVFEREGPPIAAAALEPRRAVMDVLGAEADRGTLWALVDASRGDGVLALLRSSMDPGRNLYEGFVGAALAEVAPHLIHLEPSSRLLAGLVAEGWTAGHATYFSSEEDEKTLRRHLRRFLIVEAEGIGPRTYFRFYDPAVLTELWGMATAAQKTDLSRGIDAWWVPGGADAVLRLDGDIATKES